MEKNQTEALLKNITKNNTKTLPNCTTDSACKGSVLAACSVGEPTSKCKKDTTNGDVTNWTCTLWFQYYGDFNYSATDCKYYDKCFCGRKDTRYSIKDGSITWVLGGVGEDCNRACKLIGLKCKEVSFDTISDKLSNCNLQDRILNIDGESCTSCEIGKNDNVQIYVIGKHCFSDFIDAKTLNCGSLDPAARRICPCE